MREKRAQRAKANSGSGRTRQLDLPIDIPVVARPEREDMNDPRRWLAWAAEAWCDEHERQMTVRWARDVTLIKPLLRQHGAYELARRWRAYVSTSDPFLARRGWDVPTFSVCIDRFDGFVDVAEVIGLRNLRPIRDAHTGVVRGQRRGW